MSRKFSMKCWATTRTVPSRSQWELILNQRWTLRSHPKKRQERDTLHVAFILFATVLATVWQDCSKFKARTTPRTVLRNRCQHKHYNLKATSFKLKLTLEVNCYSLRCKEECRNPQSTIAAIAECNFSRSSHLMMNSRCQMSHIYHIINQDARNM
jgi:hypothetical protein